MEFYVQEKNHTSWKMWGVLKKRVEIFCRLRPTDLCKLFYHKKKKNK